MAGLLRRNEPRNVPHKARVAKTVTAMKTQIGQRPNAAPNAERTTRNDAQQILR